MNTATALPLNNTLSSIPAIGASLPGGVMAGFMPSFDGNPAYLLVLAPLALGTTKTPRATWGEYGEYVEDLSDWDGLANTKLLAVGDHPAAKMCAELVDGDLNDYYLPSRREASLMAGAAPALFEEGYHWTSTQYSAHHAFVQDFSDGDQYRNDKGLDWRVRAVRRIIID